MTALRVGNRWVSDPTEPGSDAWAGLDDKSTAPGAWNERMAALRREMVAIRRYSARTGTWKRPASASPRQREMGRRAA